MCLGFGTMRVGLKDDPWHIECGPNDDGVGQCPGGDPCSASSAPGCLADATAMCVANRCRSPVVYHGLSTQPCTQIYVDGDTGLPLDCSVPASEVPTALAGGIGPPAPGPRPSILETDRLHLSYLTSRIGNWDPIS
jgi:hypothetical protein